MESRFSSTFHVATEASGRISSFPSMLCCPQVTRTSTGTGLRVRDFVPVPVPASAISPNADARFMRVPKAGASNTSFFLLDDFFRYHRSYKMKRPEPPGGAPIIHDVNAPLMQVREPYPRVRHRGKQCNEAGCVGRWGEYTLDIYTMKRGRLHLRQDGLWC
ncbi:hypothetical protein BD779DRAFT_275458 [Infundibulicybe gibba]|nr:hypothetical protein BD779DRAFT_275458 [Infundibulicybe gibba]